MQRTTGRTVKSVKNQTCCVAVAALALGLLAVHAEARAERKYGMAGCGLGSVIFGAKGMQSSAASTNNASFGQTFAISSGTSNCTPSGKGSAQDEQQQEKFFVANFSTLSKEIAQGSGEALTAFAGTLGCEADAAPAVANGLRGGYDRIFAQPGAVAAFDEARQTLRADPALAVHCAKL
jgi:hypothetical protein